jgi:hypothetical protein
MDPRIKRTQRDYTLAFKVAVVEQVEKIPARGAICRLKANTRCDA